MTFHSPKETGVFIFDLLRMGGDLKLEDIVKKYQENLCKCFHCTERFFELAEYFGRHKERTYLLKEEIK